MTEFDLSKRRIGILSNNWHNTHMLRMMLRMMRAGEIVSFTKRVDAQEYLKRESVDALICDWTDNGGSTIVFLSEFRHGGWAYNSEAPVLVVGSEFTPRDIAVISATATHQIILRPFSVKDVYTKLSVALAGAMPTIETEDYEGPDRRRSRQESPFGVERRFTMLREEAESYAAEKATEIRDRRRPAESAAA